MVTAAQSRAGRALIAWSQSALATAANVSLSTIRDFETGKRTPTRNNIAAIEKALVDAGVRFLATTDDAREGVQLAATGRRNRG